jgi:hypothetical protein
VVTGSSSSGDLVADLNRLFELGSGPVRVTEILGAIEGHSGMDHELIRVVLSDGRLGLWRVRRLGVGSVESSTAALLWLRRQKRSVCARDPGG